MRTPIDIIKSLIPSLTEKDQNFAYKFIEKRDFESLRDLVKSAIVIARKKLVGKSDYEKDEAVADMERLYSEVNEYCILLGCNFSDSYEEDEEECYDLKDGEERIEYDF